MGTLCFCPPSTVVLPLPLLCAVLTNKKCVLCSRHEVWLSLDIDQNARRPKANDYRCVEAATCLTDRRPSFEVGSRSFAVSKPYPLRQLTHDIRPQLLRYMHKVERPTFTLLNDVCGVMIRYFQPLGMGGRDRGWEE